jgi:hypothetical protein
MTDGAQSDRRRRATDADQPRTSTSTGAMIEGLYQAAIETVAAGSDVLSAAARDFVARDRRWTGSSRRLGHFPENLFDVASEAVNRLGDVKRRVVEAYRHGAVDFDQVKPSRDVPWGDSITASPWLAVRLRACVPAIDDDAAAALWRACRATAADCTEDEVVYCCRVTADRLVLDGAAGNVDALIEHVAKCFDGQDALYLRYRSAR